MAVCQRSHYKYEYIMSASEIKSDMLQKGFYMQKMLILKKLLAIKDNDYT